MNQKEITDVTPEAVRIQAETKQLTVDPLHTDIVADDLPDTVIAAQHVNGPAIANAPNDTEELTSLVRPAAAGEQNRPPHERHMKGATITALVVLVGAVTAIIVYTLS